MGLNLAAIKAAPHMDLKPAAITETRLTALRPEAMFALGGTVPVIPAG
ncbi:MAG: hypothetical protein JRI66_12820 [Deltaproteobacteria bacterium]|nr:hypothetical protein [Deltaproteobacteria bacterium]